MNATDAVDGSHAATVGARHPQGRYGASAGGLDHGGAGRAGACRDRGPLRCAAQRAVFSRLRLASGFRLCRPAAAGATDCSRDASLRHQHLDVALAGNDRRRRDGVSRGELCAPARRRGNRAAAFAAIAVRHPARDLPGSSSHLTTSTFEPISWIAVAFLPTRAICKERRSDLIWTRRPSLPRWRLNGASRILLAALGVVVLATCRRGGCCCGGRSGLRCDRGERCSRRTRSGNGAMAGPFLDVILLHLGARRTIPVSFWAFSNCVRAIADEHRAWRCSDPRQCDRVVRR